MRLLRDFVCDKCGTEVERYIDTTIDHLDCVCGGKMTRIIGMPKVSLDGTDPDFPGAYEKWASVREQRAREAKKRSYYEG